MKHRTASPAALALLAALVLPGAVSAQAATAQDPSITRSRLADIDVSRLRTWVLAAAQGDAMGLQLFPDVHVEVAHETTEDLRGGALVWHGRIAGHPDSEALFALRDGALAATLRYDDRLYTITAVAGGLHRVARIDPTQRPACGTTAEHAAAAPSNALPPSTSRAPSSVGPRAGSPDIELMVVYTTDAKNGHGGQAGMQALIDLAVAETNLCYENSGVDQRVVLVHTEELVGYVEPASMNTMLDELRNTSDGKMDEVHPLRAQYAADLVAMISWNGQYCGLGYLMTNVGNAFRSNAFSVTRSSCATGSYVLAHELGHNMGCAHDPGNASSAAYPYSYGYRTPNQQYRTVMAYAPGARIPYFSNLTETYAGMALGAPLQDNARSLNDTAATVAGWGDPPPVNPLLVQPYLRAGQQTSLACYDCTPNGTVHFAFSVQGGGPSPSQWGALALTPPIHVAAVVVAGTGGFAYSPVITPAGTVGRTVWLQALDQASGTLSNGVTTVIH